ncbi:MAG: DUF711 family protein [Anaerolineaceae bacterium]|jgi:hypothetical protein
MRIRSITSFFDPRSPQAESHLAVLAELSTQYKKAIETQVMPVLSSRLATVPFPLYLSDTPDSSRIVRVTTLANQARDLGWEYFSIGPALPHHSWSYSAIPGFLSIAQDIFSSAVVSDRSRLYPAAVRASAQVIRDLTTLQPDGFANLRFSALANVPPGTPFLPAAYHQADQRPAISLAVECADAVLESFTNANDLDTARQRLLTRLEAAATQLSGIFSNLTNSNSVEFLGFDFSPAPFPQDWCSLGRAVETVGLEHIGGIGSLGAVAIIADTLDRGNWPRAGFNGMMLPVLEDSVLARRAQQGSLTIQDLLLYSTVCGTGLDTIPLPGNTPVEDLEAVIMDIAALSVRLGKPLTARLMPIPGKTAGDPTTFEFEYFNNSRVMAIEAQKVSLLANADQSIPLEPRKFNS